jgi:hypothetical protein
MKNKTRQAKSMEKSTENIYTLDSKKDGTVAMLNAVSASTKPTGIVACGIYHLYFDKSNESQSLKLLVHGIVIAEWKTATAIQLSRSIGTHNKYEGWQRFLSIIISKSGKIGKCRLENSKSEESSNIVICRKKYTIKLNADANSIVVIRGKSEKHCISESEVLGYLESLADKEGEDENIQSK